MMSAFANDRHRLAMFPARLGTVCALDGPLAIKLHYLGPQAGIRATAVGELDMDTAPVLRGLLAFLIAREWPSRIALDMGRIDFCDGRGVTEVQWTRHLAAERGTVLDILRTSAAVDRVLRLAGFGEDTDGVAL